NQARTLIEQAEVKALKSCPIYRYYLGMIALQLGQADAEADFDDAQTQLFALNGKAYDRYPKGSPQDAAFAGFGVAVSYSRGRAHLADGLDNAQKRESAQRDFCDALTLILDKAQKEPLNEAQKACPPTQAGAAFRNLLASYQIKLSTAAIWNDLLV